MLQSRSLQKFHGNERTIIVLADFVDRADVRMVESRCSPCLAAVDHQRAGLVRQAFEWVATRSYSLEEILRRLRLLGLTTRRANRPLVP